MTATLRCRSVTVRYGPVVAVDHLDLAVDDGETLALLGPSGSGKSTLMYAVAGFLPVDGGTIEIDGVEVSTERLTLPPEVRPVGLVFQSYALWPHLTAEETVAYPMRRSGAGKGDAMRAARELLVILGIQELAGRYPGELSGGQQQRVGLARALAREARLYLFDEPTAHLDSSMRVTVQEEIARRRAETGAAAVYATHDSSEALAVADRVAVLRAGSVVQLDTPRAIYERPVDVWAARLTGPASIFEVERIRAGNGQVEVALGASRVLADTVGSTGGRRARLLVRPEWVAIEGPLGGVVRELWFRGPHTDYRLETAVGSLHARLPGPPRLGIGESSGWTIERGWVPPSASGDDDRSSFTGGSQPGIDAI